MMDSFAAGYSDYSVSSDYPSRYGRPWLKAAAVPLPNETRQYLHKPAHGSPGAGGTSANLPQYTQGHLPRPPREPFASPPHHGNYMPSDYSSTASPYEMEELDGEDRAVQAPSVQRPRPVVPFHAPRPRASSAARAAGGSGDQAPAVKDGAQGRPVYGAMMTSLQVRDAVYADWLVQKRAAQRAKAATRPVTSLGNSMTSSRADEQAGKSGGRPATAKPSVQRVLTPEELFQDSDHVRRAAFEDWMAKKLIKKQDEQKVKKAAEKELMSSAELAQARKLGEADDAYISWKAKNDEKLAQGRAKAASARKEKERQREAEEKEKKESAESAFLAWKKCQDGKLKESQEEKRRRTRESAAKEREEEESTAKSSVTAFGSWKATKDAELQKDAARRRRVEADRRRIEDEMKERKEREGRAAMAAWTKHKEATNRPKTRNVRTPSPVIQARMVWSPPGIGDGGAVRRTSSPETIT